MRPSAILGERTRWPRSDAEVRWGIGAALICFLAAQVFAAVWAVTVLGLAFDGGIPELAELPLWALPVANLGLWLVYLAGPVVANRLTGSGPLVDFDLRSGPIQFMVAAVIGVATQLLVLPVLYWFVTKVLDGDPSRTAEELVGRVEGPIDIMLLVLSVVLLAPLAEEWFYRGMLLSALVRRIGPWGGAVATSLIFAAAHGEVILLPGLFAFAMVLAGLTLWTGRVGVAVVAHLAFNATTVVRLLAF